MKSLRRSAEVDWLKLHERLAQSAAAGQQAAQPSHENVARLLDERARRLAKPLQVERTGTALIDLLAFGLGGERYAIEARYVREVLRNPAMTPLPGLPDTVAGIANLRGDILAVFDIRGLLGLGAGEISAASRILVCGTERPDLALIVDSVSDVLRLPAEDIMKKTGDDHSASFVRGMTRDAVIVLDGDALLSDSRLFIDQSQAGIPASQGD